MTNPPFHFQVHGRTKHSAVRGADRASGVRDAEALVQHVPVGMGILGGRFLEGSARQPELAPMLRGRGRRPVVSAAISRGCVPWAR